MKKFANISVMLLGIVLLTLVSSCSLPSIPIRDYLRPVKVFFNRERSYWTDTMDLKGETGTERVYYKNGRLALEKTFDEEGLLKEISYFGRNGRPIRIDSLVYAGDELIAGYYFSEPDHRIILTFLSYKKQGQLSQRSWFNGLGELLGREFFLFDRRGQRQMQMIFDGNDSLLYSERYRAGTDQLDIQNIYNLNGQLVSQVRFEPDRPTFRYDFGPHGSITRISQLYDNGNPAWSSDLFYGSDGLLVSSNFSVNGQFLFTYLGDMEINWQSMRRWTHPDQPGHTEADIKVGHRDPFIIEMTNTDNAGTIQEYHLPKSNALFKRRLMDEWGRPIADTLYQNQGLLQPLSVISYDTLGQVEREITYDNQGQAKWKHTWFKDDKNRVIREELTALPDSFLSAVTRIYDPFGLPAVSEHFSSPDSFSGSWVFYRGGGVHKTLYYDDTSELTESWLFRPAGDTVRHSRYQSVGYIRIESKYGHGDSLISQRRFTEDGILDWELYFDNDGRLVQETYRKRDGSIYREVYYDHDAQLIKSSTFAPVEVTEYVDGASLKGELSSQVIKRLNAAGQTVQVVSRNSSGEVAWEKRYAYRSGRLVKSAQLGSDGKPQVISSYTHNGQGQVIEETALDSEGNLVHTVTHKYNSKHELIWRMFESIPTGTLSSNRYYYDKDGLLKRNEIIESKRFIEAVEYDYYPQYYLRIATHYDPKGQIIRKEIENYFADNVFSMTTATGGKEK